MLNQRKNQNLEDEKISLIPNKMREFCKIDDDSRDDNQNSPSKVSKNKNFKNDKEKSTPANNNDDSFISEYPPQNHLLSTSDQLPVSGRVSGGSNEFSSSSSSAFYDESEEDNGQLLDSSGQSSEQSSPSSGRSSANKTPDSLDIQLADTVENKVSNNFKVLNPISNLWERSEKYHNTIEKIRVKFLDSLQEEGDRELYEDADLKELKKPLPPVDRQEESLAFRLISRYLSSNRLLEKKPVESCEDDDLLDACVKQCVENLTALLKFRSQYKLTNVLEEEFSREFYLISGAYVFGHDKQTLPVLYMRARVHRRWSKNLDEAFRRYLSWQLDIITRSNHGVSNVKRTIGLNGIEKDGSFGICFDCADVGYSCLDMDFLRFIVNLLVNYYPTYCRYALCVDLPWLFRSVWKLVRSWLPEDARETVQLITCKQLTEFIDQDQIPNSFKYNDFKASEKPKSNKHTLPQNWSSIKGIEEIGKDIGMSSTEIKQFKTHVEKLRKEYESLGAL